VRAGRCSAARGTVPTLCHPPVGVVAVVCGRPGEGGIVRVLLVSESPAERSRASSALALLDTFVDGIADAVVVVEEAAAAAVQARIDLDGFDVLVIDGDLRPKGGFSLLYELRAMADLDKRAQLPAIVLVERAGDDWLGEWAGADVVLRKPVDPFELGRAVAALAATAPA